MKANWRTHGVPFLDFNQELTQEWIIQGFTKHQTQDWLGSGLKATDAWYAGWLRDIKHKDSDWVLNYGDNKALRAKYKEWQLQELTNLKIPTHQPFTPVKYQYWLTVLLLAIIVYYLLTK